MTMKNLLLITTAVLSLVASTSLYCRWPRGAML